MPIRVVPNAFSIMGNVDDTVIMVKEMRIKFPKNFIGLAGVSAGSGMYIIKHHYTNSYLNNLDLNK